MRSQQRTTGICTGWREPIDSTQRYAPCWLPPMQTLNDKNTSDGAGFSTATGTSPPDPGRFADAASARTGIGPWLQAARPLAHPMIFIPLAIGQAYALHTNGAFSWAAFAGALLFGVLYQVYLLYTNDHADEAIDRTNEQHWLSGGSRVLPEGKLNGDQLLVGARLALVALAGLSLFLAVFKERPWMPVALLLAAALCWGYNRPPLQLSYRGHGEVLQGLGCGVLLPLIGYYLQQGSLAAFPWLALIPLYLVVSCRQYRDGTTGLCLGQGGQQEDVSRAPWRAAGESCGGGFAVGCVCQFRCCYAAANACLSWRNRHPVNSYTCRRRCVRPVRNGERGELLALQDFR